jgi:6-pyruvoyltetrahydropterin/6-carboxytetrahydropterin synthase
MIIAKRYHDISCGHRVVGHESKCRFFHGHNYRVHFHITRSELDGIGRVLDFSVIKTLLCEWLEDNWDHRFLMWENDPFLEQVFDEFPGSGFLAVPFNPTAENMAQYLVTVIGPQVLPKEVELVKVIIDETRKCSVEAIC